jgi:divalent metal cation (Fe/Co/Zn/Cd) transporter
MAHLLGSLFRPAILLALVPLIRFAFEKAFGRVFRNSTKEALDKAARPDNKIEAVRNAVANENVRAALAQYVENAASLERFFETCFFAGLSLLVWALSEAEKRWEQILSVALLFVIVVALVTVGVKALKEAYEPGRKDATKTPARFAQVFSITIVMLEVLSTLMKSKAE